MCGLCAATLAFGFFGFGWAVHLRADQEFDEMVGDSSEVIQSIAFVEDALGTAQTLEIDVRIPPGSAIEDPATLETLAGFSAGLSPIGVPGEAESVLDLLERLKQAVEQAFARLHNSGRRTEKVCSRAAAAAKCIL